MGKNKFYLISYLAELFSRKGPAGPKNVNIRIMHNINRIAVVMFVVGIVLLIIKLFRG